MNQAVILHGTDGRPDINWFPWLAKKLKSQGCEVWVPLLPENHTPNRTIYNDFLLNSDWDFEDSVVIGHSSGAVEVMNLLIDERCPKIKLAVMVGAWAGGVPNGYEEGNRQFDDLFPPQGFDFELIKSKADKIMFMHGDDDPYCPLEQAKYLAGKLDAPIKIIPGGHHLGSKYTELPGLWDIIRKYL